MKDALGVPRSTTFHSFRHSASTMLRNTFIPEAWIDAVLGHEGEQRSMGATVYLKRIGIQNLRTTVEAIVYPEEMLAAVRQAVETARRLTVASASPQNRSATHHRPARASGWRNSMGDPMMHCAHAQFKDSPARSGERRALRKAPLRSAR
ncbi:hypothetical protein ACFQU7_08750 [Pseudoroseomonas wenyumeiae]